MPLGGWPAALDGAAMFGCRLSVLRLVSDSSRLASLATPSDTNRASPSAAVQPQEYDLKVVRHIAWSPCHWFRGARLLSERQLKRPSAPIDDPLGPRCDEEVNKGSNRNISNLPLRQTRISSYSLSEAQWMDWNTKSQMAGIPDTVEVRRRKRAVRVLEFR
jgi:hypothetical protein